MLSAEFLLKLLRLEEKLKSSRKRHRINRKLRGHKSPSELRRRERRETLFLLAQLPTGLFPDEPVVDTTFPSPSASCDETDWFAGNEWCEGSF
nr:2b protein [Peanut stunt virus]